MLGACKRLMHAAKSGVKNADHNSSAVVAGIVKAAHIDLVNLRRRIAVRVGGGKAGLRCSCHGLILHAHSGAATANMFHARDIG